MENERAGNIYVVGQRRMPFWENQMKEQLLQKRKYERQWRKLKQDRHYVWMVFQGSGLTWRQASEDWRFVHIPLLIHKGRNCLLSPMVRQRLH